MNRKIPWPRLEAVGVALVVMHSLLVGILLMFLTGWTLRFAGFDHSINFFFPRQSGAVATVIALPPPPDHQVPARAAVAQVQQRGRAAEDPLPGHHRDRGESGLPPALQALRLGPDRIGRPELRSHPRQFVDRTARFRRRRAGRRLAAASASVGEELRLASLRGSYRGAESIPARHRLRQSKRSAPAPPRATASEALPNLAPPLTLADARARPSATVPIAYG